MKGKTMKTKAGRPKKTKEAAHVEEKRKEEKRDVLEDSPLPEPKINKDGDYVLPMHPETQAKLLEQKPEPVHFKEKSDAPIADRIAESRKALDHPLQPGQAFFESPEGEILVGEADKGKMWSRTMNGGKGGWINPRR